MRQHTRHTLYDAANTIFVEAKQHNFIVQQPREWGAGIPIKICQVCKNHEMGFLCHIGESCPRKEFPSYISLSGKTSRTQNMIWQLVSQAPAERISERKDFYLSKSGKG